MPVCRVAHTSSRTHGTRISQLPKLRGLCSSHVASDCTGPQNAHALGPTPSGANKIFIIVCQFSHYIWLWLILCSVKEVKQIVRDWLKVTIGQRRRIKSKDDIQILTWRTDNGPDFPSGFTDLLTSFEIYHQIENGIKILAVEWRRGDHSEYNSEENTYPVSLVTWST